MPETAGKLYIVATPIGNLGDISFRAVEILKQCDRIAAEDTRQTRRLLAHYAINRPLMALHEHNEAAAGEEVLRRLREGENIALVSDAGTPLVSDPGYRLVHRCVIEGLIVVPLPGACALIAALSASAMAVDRFTFVGFPPRGREARRTWLESLREIEGTLIFYESCHRIIDCLEDVAGVFPAGRECAIARELTKVHESILKTEVGAIGQLIREQPYLDRGELVVLLQGATRGSGAELDPEHRRLLQILLQECSVKTSAVLAARITGVSRKQLYNAALELKS